LLPSSFPLGLVHIILNENECPCQPYKPTEEKWSTICDYFNLGDPAPEFTLDGICKGEKVQVSLKDYLKKWILLFFYGSDFTFV